MKLFSLLSVAAVSAFSFSAFAADDFTSAEHLGKEKEKKILKFDISCKFGDDKHDLLGGKDDGKDEGQDDKRKDRCYAAATLFKKIDDKKGGHDAEDVLNDHEDDEMDGDSRNDKYKNRFAVYCNHSLEYADGAKVDKKDGTLRIQPPYGHKPAVSIYLDRHDDVAEINSDHKWLDAKLDRKYGDDLRGACKIRVKKLNERY